MAERRFSLAHLTALECSPPDLIRIAAAAGYDFVGLRTMPFGLPGEPRYNLSQNPTLLEETAIALADTGVRLLDIELARILDGHHPKQYLPAMEVGAELGAAHVLSSIWTTDRDDAVEQFGVLCDLARPLGLTVNLEFVAWADCATLVGALDVVRSAKRDNGAILIDTFHFHQAGIDLTELDRIPRDWCNYAHVNDDRPQGPNTLEDCKRRGREERLFPGEGDINIAGILNHLPEHVICAIELPHLARIRQAGPAAYVRQCLEETKRVLERTTGLGDGG